MSALVLSPGVPSSGCARRGAVYGGRREPGHCPLPVAVAEAQRGLRVGQRRGLSRSASSFRPSLPVKQMDNPSIMRDCG